MIFEAGVPISASVKRGFASVLREEPLLRLRVAFSYGKSEEAQRTQKFLSWILPRECDINNELLETGPHLLSFRIAPDIILVIFHSRFFIPPLEKSLLYHRGCPILIAMVPENSNLFPAEVASLFELPHIYWIPFGWFPSGKNPDPSLVTRTDLWGEGCYLALQGKQLHPRYLEHTGIW